MVENLPRDVGSTGQPVLRRDNVLAAADVWQAIGGTHLARGETAQAEVFLAGAWELVKNNRTAEMLGEIFESQGREQEAVDLYSRFVWPARAGTEIEARLVRLIGRAAVDSIIAERALPPDLVFQIANTERVVGRAAVWLLVDASGVPNEVLWRGGDGALTRFLGAVRTSRLPMRFPPLPPLLIELPGRISCPEGYDVCNVEIGSAMTIMMVPEPRTP